jgi:predicted Zn-dependent peptidase
MTLNRVQHPAFNKIKNINFPPVEEIHLDNGIPVYILNGGTQDVLKMDVMVNAGAIFSSKKLIAPVAGLMLNEGTTHKTAHEIAELFDFYGAYFQPSIEKDVAFCGLISLSKHLDKTLPLFNEILNNSTFPIKEVESLLKRRKQNFRVDSKKTSFVARELFNEQLYGFNHPYGIKTCEDDYDTLTQKEVFDFYKSHYNSANYKIILSGKVSDAHIKLLNKEMGQLLPSNKVTIPQIEPAVNTSTEPIISLKEDAVQSSLRMGFLTVNKNHPDYLGLKILTTIFGGYFGSRLMKNIREEKGYTYGIHSMLVSLQNGGFMGIAADVKAQHAREAVTEIKKEMEKLCNDKISLDELNRVQNYMMGEMLQMFDGPFATSDSFKGVLQYQMGFEYFEKMKETILGITPEDLQTLAQKHYHTNKLITVVAGKYD